MIEATGNLFEYRVDAVVVPVNWTTKANGEAVMGAGVAKQAAERWPWLPVRLGNLIEYAGGVSVRAFPTLPDGLWVVAFPTKGDWRKPASLDLIEGLVPSLLRMAEHYHWRTVALPRLGCGLGQLDWETQVRPILADHLDDRFVVVTPA